MELTINVNVNASPALSALLDELLGDKQVSVQEAQNPPFSSPQTQTQTALHSTTHQTPPVVQISAPPVAPVTSAPSYTLDQLAAAGAALASAGKLLEAQELLKQFGIQSISQLPKEQYGAFATALRGLGVQI